MRTERRRRQGETAAVDTAQLLLTGVGRKSGIWEYTLEQRCQPRKGNLGPFCPSPGNPLLMQLLLPMVGGRVRDRNKSEPHNIDKSLSASAQSLLLELSNSLEEALPP